jgi:hypothetical protein
MLHIVVDNAKRFSELLIVGEVLERMKSVNAIQVCAKCT